MVSPEIILVNYYFLLLIFDLVPLRYVSTKITTANVDIRYHNVDHSSNKHETECPRGWTRYERTKSCFHVIERRMRWSEAERACANFGGHLASITDEYENMFAFNVAKDANLSTPTLWLGRLVKLTRTGAYEWNDGAVGRHTDGFRGELPSGTDLCLTMWLDFDRPEGSWNEWDCNYASGYSALCKRSLKRTPINTTAKPNIRSGIDSGLSYYSRRCCLISSLCHNTSQSCTSEERCIPDDLDCWARTCLSGGIGWCLPLPKIQSLP
uniref:C-type lectin domain-containing protein n=1 Tax=Wuchereria bancrofti TaxID=6293 RepID=A0AAF5Q1F6_WUCBA